MRFLHRDIAEAAKRHALACYPEESCGAVTAAGYIPFINVDANPKEHFSCDEQMEPLILAGKLLALVHSHPDGPIGPSSHDMAQQVAMDIPWGIVVCAEDAALDPYFWGDMLTPPPLIGRDFRHGPSGTDGKGDCYALIRDWFRINRNVVLADFPRDDGWWKRGGDLYREQFGRWGFEVAPDARSNPQIGDVLLMQYQSKVPNHGAIYIGNGRILHHLGNRLSCEEPLIRWASLVSMWIRHHG